MLDDGVRGGVRQRDGKTYAVAPNLPCGMATPQVLRKIADVAEKYGAVLKLTGVGRIALIGLKAEDIDAVWDELQIRPGAITGLCVRNLRACPGTTYCRLGQQDSLKLGERLYKELLGLSLPSKFKPAVSGCPNACVESWVRDLGFIGKKKGWTMLVGGNAGARPRIALVLAEGLDDDTAVALSHKVIEFYKANAKGRERLGRTIERLGLDALKAAVLGDLPKEPEANAADKSAEPQG